MTELRTFLKTVKVPKGEPFNFTEICRPWGSYMVPEDKFDEFYRLYVKHVSRVSLHLTEKPGPASPVLVDLDFKYDLAVKERRHTRATVEAVVKEYFDFFANYVILDSEDLCYVQQRAEPYATSKETKDGFHLVFPSIRCAADLKLLARFHVMSACRELFLALGVTNSVQDVVDRAVISRNNWFVYGSGKEGLPAHTVTLVLNRELQEVDVDLSMDWLVKLLSVRGEEETVRWKDGAKDQVGRELAVAEKVEKDRVAAEKAGKQPTKKSPGVKSQPSTSSAPPASTSSASEDTVVRLLGLLSSDRWDDRFIWVDLAILLKNVGGETYKWAWLKLSATSGKFDEPLALSTWDSAANNPNYSGPRLGLGTLHRWAREDSPLGHAQLRIDQIPQVALTNWHKGDVGLAMIAKHVVGEQLKLVAGRGKRDWYFFDEDSCLWRLVNDSTVKLVISKRLEDVLRDVQAKFTGDARTCEDPDDKEEADRRTKSVMGVVKYVTSNKGLNNVVSLGCDLFLENDFEQRLDRKKHLIGVQNGVVDLRTGQLRQRAPDDMIFKVLDVNFDATADYGWVHSLVTDMMADDKEMARFLQILLGYGITGETCEEVFPVFTGTGRNGKGFLTQSLRALLGGFYKEMSCAIIVDRHVSNIDAERAKMKGGRIIVFNELQDGEKLRTSEVQLITGGDGIPAKELFKDPITIDPHHLCILTTNHMPQLEVVIPAIMERLLCVHFPVFFTDLADGEEPSVFRRQKDQGLKKRMDEDKPALLKWLVDGAVAWYANQGLKRIAPARVTEFTRDYLNDQDKVETFLLEKCDRTGNSKTPAKVLFGTYSTWAAESSLSGDCTSARYFHAKMRLKGFVKKSMRDPATGKPVDGYCGVAIKPVTEAVATGSTSASSSLA